MVDKPLRFQSKSCNGQFTPAISNACTIHLILGYIAINGTIHTCDLVNYCMDCKVQ